MKRKRKKSIRLTALLWRYLLTSFAAALCIALLWWTALMTLVRIGFVLPANTAEREVANQISHASQTGVFNPPQAAPLFRWAIMFSDAQVLDRGNMSDEQLAWAAEALCGGSFAHGFPYTQYHRWTQLADGSTLILQFDYAMRYADSVRQSTWPDFQILMFVVLLILEAAAAALNTGRYTRLLHADARKLHAAAHAIARERLDQPFSESCTVTELAQTLEAMDSLRATLADSLRRQWSMEQQCENTSAALADALRTPLSVISGHAELLHEDLHSSAQKDCAAAILSEAENIQRQIEALLPSS